MSIPIKIPERLSRNKKWEGWLAQLPDTLAACAKKWDLRIEEPTTEDYAEMSYGYITPATQSDGTEVVLKSIPSTHITELKERQALEVCDGNSTIKLLGYDEKLGTIMIERACPGVPLSVNPDDEENTRIACHMMQGFWRPLPDKHNFRSTDYEIEGFERLRKNTAAPPASSQKSGPYARKCSIQILWRRAHKPYSCTPTSIITIS